MRVRAYASVGRQGNTCAGRSVNA
ncbi:hypothetical protein ACLB1M_08630 [Escherichia coli]